MKGLRKKDHNRGVTMVETLVAFAILAIISLSFLAIIRFSSNMTMEADDKRALAQELDEKLSHKTEGNFEKRSWSISLVSDSGESISLKDCEVYSLSYPADDPKLTVLRFQKK